MQSNEKYSSNREKEAPPSPHYLPDLPLPTPPPMANIMMTSRFDLQTRGGCGYRRILSSRSTTDFSAGRSPIFPRSMTFQREPNFNSYRDRCVNTLSPLPVRHRTFEDLSKSQHKFTHQLAQSRSKYFAKDSAVSEEIEEVEKLSKELQQKFRHRTQEISPDYQSVYFNEHYMSDIDENEEIKEFSVGYKTPDTDISDDISTMHGFFNKKSNDVNYSLSSDLDYADVFDSGVFMKYYNLDTNHPQERHEFQTISTLDLRAEQRKPRKRCSKRNSPIYQDLSGSLMAIPTWKSVQSCPQNSSSEFNESNSSFKSSEFCSDSPGSMNKGGFREDHTKAITKNPYRPVVKLANIRLVKHEIVIW
ncbi:hypothetical protein HHI36_000302 [Cryptolaemus montrouzieri]|uniref:Uncharacterized protein n=1 Tax=Cryptolaemus montrouzieri TaxID=559131 RepID=A0ABD2P475_9CUCU